MESETKQWPDAVLLQDATTWGNSQSRVVRVGHQGAAMPRPIKHCNGQNPDGTDCLHLPLLCSVLNSSRWLDSRHRPTPPREIGIRDRYRGTFRTVAKPREAQSSSVQRSPVLVFSLNLTTEHRDSTLFMTSSRARGLQPGSPSTRAPLVGEFGQIPSVLIRRRVRGT